MEETDLHLGTDNHGVASGDKSMFDSVADVVTQGVQLTGLSVYNSFVNTAVDVANFFGGEFERNDPVKQLQEYDDDLLKYYKEHSQGIEAAGLLVGSLLPGTIAIKALKLAQAGQMGENLARATGIFAGKKKSILEDATKEIQMGNSSLFGNISSQKIQAIAYGFGDQALQAAAWETATVATMKANPLLDKDGFGDVISHVTWATLLGGGVGGVIEGIATRATINKLVLAQNEKEKIFELAKRVGLGDFNHGDRVSELIQSVDKIPPPSTASETAKASRNRQQAETDAWKILKEISPEADENLGKGFLDALQRMRNDSLLSPDEMYDYLGRLSRVSRLTEHSHQNPNNVFYFNKHAQSSGKYEDDLSRVFTAKPDEAAELSLAYVLRDSTVKPKVARFDTLIATEDGTRSVPRYDSKTAAFKAGEDIFWDSKLQFHVNPDSENFIRVPRPGESRILSEAEEKQFRTTGKVGSDKPLYGAPLYFDLHTGKVANRAFAVVGDLGPIKSLKDTLTKDSHGVINGIQVGEHSFHQYLETGFSYHDISSLDANSRYVWAAARGVKQGDIVNYNDLPMLEQLIRHARENGDDMSDLRKLKVRIRGSSGTLEDLPDSVSGLESQTWRAKDEVVSSLLGDGSKKVDVAEVAIKANVPQQYIQDGLRASKFSDVTVPVENHIRTNKVKLEYDIGDLNVQEGNILRGSIDTQYRIQLAEAQALNAHYNFFGDKAEAMLAGKFTAGDSNVLGAGAKGLTAASADYTTLAQRVEGMGAAMSRWLQDKRSEVSDALGTVIHTLQGDPQAGAELAVITNIGRRISRRFVLLPEELAPNTMVLEGSVKRDPSGKIISWNKDYIPPDQPNGTKGVWIKGSRFGKLDYDDKAFEGAFTYYQLNPKVFDFLKAGTKLNDERLVHHNNWMAAQGISRKYDLGSVYFPPIDTTRYKYVAIVRDAEGIAFGTSDAAALVSDTAEGLQKKVSLVLQDNPGARISTKQSSKDYHEALGDYDYSLNMVQSAVDSNLTKKGILSDILPNVRGETQIKEYFDWHIRQVERQARNFMELGNAQLFEELTALGKKFTEIETAQAGPVAGRLFNQVKNPFESYIKTALNISPKSSYRLWQEVQEKTEAFAATAFRKAKEFLGQAEKGLISYDQATELTKKYGLGNPYQRTLEALGDANQGSLKRISLERFGEANKLPLEPILSRFVQKANSVLAATTLRLDAFQTLINIVSTPVLLTAEFQSVKRNPELQRLLTTEVPGSNGAVSPAYSKILFESVGDFFGSEKEALIKRYRELGTVRELSSDYHEMLNSLTISGSETARKLEEMGERAVQFGVKISRADWGEEFVRFVASRTADKLFEALGHSGQMLDDSIRTFVNRVHGNYIAAQRPVAFQGPIGQAIGLFQTYQFNLLQQVFRYVENREALPLASLFGIQGTLFGLQGIPGFQAINTHIVGNASNNPEHKDFYSTVPQFFDKTLGNWLLYGSVSNFLQTGLYSRGDINPRQITVLPVNPLDYPAIGAGIRFVSNLIDLGKKTADGAKFSDALLQGLEHNGLSRPLAGIGQIVQGYSTTSKGSLISASSDWDTIATASRILGARPLDEAVALDALYRKTAYQAKDTARISQLGEAVKTTLIGNHAPSQEETQRFAAEYAAAGGRIEHFGAKMVEWTRDANQSVANQIYRSMRSPLNQNMMKVMGGDMLPDYSRTPPTTSVPSSVTQE